MALGLGNGWKVTRSEMNVEERTLDLWLDFEKGAQFPCPQCGEFSPVHDTSEKTWRHLDFWQHKTHIHARTPRICCQQHGVLTADVPWARSGSGFTLMMEGFILLLAQQMTVLAAARLLEETDQKLWRVLDHYVTEAHKAKDWKEVQKIMVDETSTKKGHNYATNFMDADTRELLFTVQGRDRQTIDDFAVEMIHHGALPSQITEIIMDMSRAFQSGAREYFPSARLVFDHFHIMKLAGDALDGVRKWLIQECGLPKGGLWAIRGNEGTRSLAQRAERKNLAKLYPALGRALHLRESLQTILLVGDEEGLRRWCSWARRSRLPAFKKLAQTLKDHWDGVLAFMETRLTNAAMEAVNGILQLAKRMARGFRNFRYFRIMAYLRAGGLQLNTAH